MRDALTTWGLCCLRTHAAKTRQHLQPSFTEQQRDWVLRMMVRNTQKKTPNGKAGKKIQHPPSTNFHDDLQPPAAKRLRTFESIDGENSRDVSEDEGLIQPDARSFRNEIPDSDAEEELDQEDAVALPVQRPTELESALPAVSSDKEAIAEYEAMRATEEESKGLEERLKQRSWTRGKSSIYVDAFNLALETVLEDEGHLFDEREMEVFTQWRALEYEAQYL